MDVPSSLLNWQKFYTEVLRGPLNKNYPEGLLFYRESHWEKMVRILNSHFGLLGRLLGEKTWIEQAVHPFIQSSPPPTANILDWVIKFPHWLSQEGKENLSPILIPLANLEALHLKVISSLSLPLPSLDQVEIMRFVLQPHLHFFSSHYPLFFYREQLLSGSTDLKIEKKKEEQWIALSLNRDGDTVLIELDIIEKEFLESFNGRSLDETLTHLELQKPSLLQEMGPQIGKFMTRWLKMEWLAIQTT